jgi:hypothetical protein
MQSRGVATVRSDFHRTSLPDQRLNERVERIASVLARHPERSLPRLLDEAALEGTYRFVNNRRVKFDDLLGGHRDGTKERAAGLGVALALHDTTEFRFGGDQQREGLGLDNAFQGHFSMLVSAEGRRKPLGISGVEAIFRSKRRSKKEPQRSRYHDKNKESLRWIRMVDHVEQHFGSTVDLVHVMDSEADWYDLLHHMVRAGHRFVVRMSKPRSVLDSRARPLSSTVSELLDRVCAVAERDVVLSPRSKKGRPGKVKKKHPPRAGRVAKLEIAARSITFPRPPSSRAEAETITLNLVQVREVDAPPDEAPIEWLLGTTEPIDEVADVLAIVDHYRTRWMIEEYFKAMKTGCAYEKRQFESRHALLNMLALLVPVAWMLLALRKAVDEDSVGPPNRLLSSRQHAVLRAALRQRAGRDVLPESPTERDVALGVARLGGYINKARPPGWRVLGYGYQDLLAMEAGWALARGQM